MRRKVSRPNARACGCRADFAWASHAPERQGHRPAGRSPPADRILRRFHRTDRDTQRRWPRLMFPKTLTSNDRESRGNRAFTICSGYRKRRGIPKSLTSMPAGDGFRDVFRAAHRSPANPHLSLLCGKSPIDSGTYDVHIKRIMTVARLPKLLTFDARPDSPASRTHRQIAPENAHLSMTERDQPARYHHRLLCFCGEHLQFRSCISSP
jgi:hypothetical protein